MKVSQKRPSISLRSAICRPSPTTSAEKGYRVNDRMSIFVWTSCNRSAMPWFAHPRWHWSRK
jgi:hypothetical protein